MTRDEHDYPSLSPLERRDEPAGRGCVSDKAGPTRMLAVVRGRVEETAGPGRLGSRSPTGWRSERWTVVWVTDALSTRDPTHDHRTRFPLRAGADRPAKPDLRAPVCIRPDRARDHRTQLPRSVRTDAPLVPSRHGLDGGAGPVRADPVRDDHGGAGGADPGPDAVARGRCDRLRATAEDAPLPAGQP